MEANNTIKIAFIVSLAFHTAIVAGPVVNGLIQKPQAKQFEITYSRMKEYRALAETMKKQESKAKALAGEKASIKIVRLEKDKSLAQAQKNIQRAKTKTAKVQQAPKKKEIALHDTRDKDADIVIPPLPKGIEKTPAYLDYVQAVREKIRRVASSRYRQPSSGGEVLLHFVLLSDGSLSAVKIVHDRSCPDEKLRQLAREAIQYASPFDSFPQDLDYKQLSFSVVISFE